MLQVQTEVTRYAQIYDSSHTTPVRRLPLSYAHPPQLDPCDERLFALIPLEHGHRPNIPEDLSCSIGPFSLRDEG